MNTVHWIPCSPEPDLFVRTQRLTVVVQAFKVSSHGTQTTVQCLWLRGEMDPESVSSVEELIHKLVARGDLRLGLDMSRLTHIHSSALDSLIEEASRLEAAGGGMRILAPTEEVRELVELLGLQHCLPMDASFRDHLRQLAFHQPEREPRKAK